MRRLPALEALLSYDNRESPLTELADMFSFLANLLKRRPASMGGQRTSRPWQGDDRLQITAHEKFDRQSSFVRPNPWMHAVGTLPGSSEPVCKVGYGVSPLNDRIYVDGLEVHDDFREQGYATELLVRLSRMAGGDRLLPLTAMRETWLAHGFWDTLRERRPHGLVVTQDIRGEELDEEKKRWTS